MSEELFNAIVAISSELHDLNALITTQNSHLEFIALKLDEIRIGMDKFLKLIEQISRNAELGAYTSSSYSRFGDH